MTDGPLYLHTSTVGNLTTNYNKFRRDYAIEMRARDNMGKRKLVQSDMIFMVDLLRLTWLCPSPLLQLHNKTSNHGRSNIISNSSNSSTILYMEEVEEEAMGVEEDSEEEEVEDITSGVQVKHPKDERL